MTQIRNALSLLSMALEHYRPRWAVEIEQTARKDDTSLKSFLVSNALWGGAGSIADNHVPDEAKQRKIRDILIRLGILQMELNIVNPRTKGWVSVFQEWNE
jgi:hypothetical protein